MMRHTKILIIFSLTISNISYSDDACTKIKNENANIEIACLKVNPEKRCNPSNGHLSMRGYEWCASYESKNRNKVFNLLFKNLTKQIPKKFQEPLTQNKKIFLEKMDSDCALNNASLFDWETPPSENVGTANIAYSNCQSEHLDKQIAFYLWLICQDENTKINSLPSCSEIKELAKRNKELGSVDVLPPFQRSQSMTAANDNIPL